MLRPIEFSASIKSHKFKTNSGLNSNLSDIFQAVLSGLTVIRPQDSLAYIEENLGDLKDLEYSEIKW